LPPLQISKEISTIKKSITRGHANLGVRTLNCTSENFRRSLTLGTTVLHYAGHGGISYLPFENSSASVHPISMDALKTLATGITGETLKLVFLNACGTELAGRVFSEIGVGAVVCISGQGVDASNNEGGLYRGKNNDRGGGIDSRQKGREGMIEDECALTFSSSFYLALSSRKSVLEAYNIGLASVRAMEKVYKGIDYEQQASMFRLLGREESWDQVIFNEDDGYEMGGCFDMDPPRKNENLPSSPEDFEGRNLELYKLVRLILTTRVTTLAGAFGMGKSTIAVEGARYLWDREVFSAIVYVKVGSVFDLWADIEERLREYYGEIGNGDEESYYPYTHVNIDLLRRVKERNILLVLDGAESIIDKGAIRGFRNVVKTILEHTAKTKIVVTTSREAVGRLHKATESVFVIRPMNEEEIAKILMFRAPVLRRGYRGRKEFVEAVSKHRVLKEYIRGNPFRVGLVATLLQRIEDESKRDLDGVLDIMEKVKSGGEGCSEEIQNLVEDLLNTEAREEEEAEEVSLFENIPHSEVDVDAPLSSSSGRYRTGSGGSAFIARRTSSNLSIGLEQTPTTMRRRSRRSSSGNRGPPLLLQTTTATTNTPTSPGTIPGTPSGSDDLDRNQCYPSVMPPLSLSEPPSSHKSHLESQLPVPSFSVYTYLIDTPMLIVMTLTLWFAKIFFDMVKMETRDERMVTMGHLIFDFSIVCACYYLRHHK